MAEEVLLQRLAAHAALRRAPAWRRLSKRGLPLATMLAGRKLANITGRSFRARPRTFWGERMTVRIPEELSCELLGYGYFEQDLSAFVVSDVSPAGTFYDVGAHYGYFTRLASRLVGPSGRVHSFEPTPSSFELLRANAQQLDNVSLNERAVWHEPGELRLHDFGPVRSMHNSLFSSRLPTEAGEHPRGREHVVSALTLDDYSVANGVPDFVKIDAESAEPHVLRGMTGMLERHKPVLTLEVGDFGVEAATPSRALLESVIVYGYRPFEFSRNAIRPHELRDEYGYGTILLRPSSSGRVSASCSLSDPGNSR